MPACRRSAFYDNAGDHNPDEAASFRYAVADDEPRWPAWTPEPLLAL